jgi:ubiquitin C-terminal hydrolase
MNTLSNNYKGFYNLGNTCYLNSGLQLIINNKKLCNHILLLSENNNSKELYMLSQFIKNYYNDNSNMILNPNFIKEIVTNKNNEFSGFRQNDSFEFIIYFLDYIFENFKIPKLYQSITNIKIKCKLLCCLNINEHKEYNNYLILDILDNFKNLNDCYKHYKQRIKLMGDNSYYCEKCKDKRIASKRTKITYWPNHLIIILKRFTNNGRLQKNNNIIDIPLKWIQSYKLKGIVFHSGSLFGGHYIYIGYHNDKWILFNDDHINEISEEQLNNYKNIGYIYYFEKC